MPAMTQHEMPVIVSKAGDETDSSSECCIGICISVAIGAEGICAIRPSWPEAAYLGFWWNIYGPTCPSAFLMYSTTSSAGNLNPRPSDTRSTLIGYFGLLGFMATILNISPRALKVRPL